MGAWFHDSIEDARQSYNDVRKIARERIGLDERQAHLAVEIVYALTNDKGRTRAERAGANYYRGIRTTPYAPFVKLCDRSANIAYSFSRTDVSERRMAEIYRSEWPHFLACIRVDGDDVRLSVPQRMVDRIRMTMAAAD